MKKVLLISFLILLSTHFLHGQNPFITNYTLADGLPTNRFYCVLQDKEGFMWFGTDAGAIRYDGTKFEHFTTDEGLSYNTVVRMKQDIEGRIWFLNSDGSVNFFRDNQIFNETNAPFLKEIKTNFFYHDFYQDQDSTIYLYNGAAQVCVVKNEEYIDFSSSEQGSVIFNISGKSNGNLLYWEPDKIVEKKAIDDANKISQLDILVSRSFLGPNNIIYVCDLSGNIHLFRDSELLKRNFIQIESRLINDILVDDEFLWISTFDRGLFCFQNDSLIFNQPLDKLQNLIMDDQHNLWTCSNTYGIYKINTDILKYKTIGIDKFNNRGIRDIASSNSKGLWLTNGKSIYLYQNGEIYNRKLKVGGNILDNIYQLKNNSILINGTSTSLNILEDVRIDTQKNTIEHGSLKRIEQHIKKLVVDSTESLLFSFLNDYMLSIDVNNNFRIQPSTYRRWGRVKNIFINKKGDLVVNGQYNRVIRNGQVIKKSIYNQFDGEKITGNIVIDRDNEILNIDDNQLVLINKDRAYDFIKNLNDQIDYKLRDMVYYRNTLFLFSVKTIYFISEIANNTKDLNPQINRLNIEFNNINDIYCQDNNLYVASDDGLTIIPVAECVNSEPTPTRPYFSNISLDDQEVALTQGSVTFKNKNRLNIEFSSLNFSSAPSNYAYMLEGVNEDWIIGTERQVVYMNLKPGHYTFKLKSRKNLEAYSEVIELPIVVVPTFFQLIITKIVAVLILLFLALLIVRSYYKRQLASKEKDNQLVTLENRALQSMMNPHFIFNSLGSIQKFLLQNKAEEAGNYLSQFARLIRQTMNSIKSNSVLLDDEIERLRNYIELEQLRMGSRFDYTIKADSELQQDDYSIPSMLVQPFVENAIWHGISQIQEKGSIRIHFSYVDEKIMRIVIEDNGIGFEKSKVFSDSKNNMNMASSLSNKRIQLLGEKYNVNTKLVIEELHPGKENPGAKISLFVPIIN